RKGLKVSEGCPILAHLPRARRRGGQGSEGGVLSSLSILQLRASALQPRDMGGEPARCRGFRRPTLAPSPGAPARDRHEDGAPLRIRGWRSPPLHQGVLASAPTKEGNPHLINALGLVRARLQSCRKMASKTRFSLAFLCHFEAR